MLGQITRYWRMSKIARELLDQFSGVPLNCDVCALFPEQSGRIRPMSGRVRMTSGGIRPFAVAPANIALCLGASGHDVLTLIEVGLHRSCAELLWRNSSRK